MKQTRGTMTATTILVLLAVTLLLLFATVWVGLYLSRRFTEPLLAVAAATQRVAEGDALEEVEVPGSDEVAVLVDSFNAMVRRVRSSEAEILASNQELATLLATVPTGVLSVDAGGTRFRPNPAAARIARQPRAGPTTGVRSTSSISRARGAVRDDSQPGSRKTCGVNSTCRPAARRFTSISPRARCRVAAGSSPSTISPSSCRPNGRPPGARSRRRIAHEIRNPLTPIRLAAERIQKRAATLDDEMRAVVTTGCEAIVAQVSGLKELVDSFQQYARMPAIAPQPTNIGRLLRELCSLYNGVRPGLEVTVDCYPKNRSRPWSTRFCCARRWSTCSTTRPLRSSAMAGSRFRPGVADDDVILEVQDTGVGLPTEDTEVLLEPFYSTKGRGSGMGLALVHRVITDHGGSLELEEPRTDRGAGPDRAHRGAIAGPGVRLARHQWSAPVDPFGTPLIPSLVWRTPATPSSLRKPRTA